MATDFDFSDYQAHVRNKCWEKTEGFMRPAGKYDCGRPVAYPGCTVLGTPYPVTSLAGQLDSLQSRLRASIPGFAPIPPDTYHMTVADLLSSTRYGTALGDEVTKKSFIETVKRVITMNSGHTFDAHIVGIGAFPGVVVAIVDFISEKDYRWIVDLRNDIYDDKTLTNCGVARQFPFLGHVTLGYVESETVDGIDLVLDEMRGEMPTSMPFRIAGASLYGFPDMSRYDPM